MLDLGVLGLGVWWVCELAVGVRVMRYVPVYPPFCGYEYPISSSIRTPTYYRVLVMGQGTESGY